MSSTAHALASRPAAPRAAARALPSRPRASPSFAERATTSGASAGRGAVAVSARIGFGSADDAVADEDAAISRRTLLAGKALFTLGEAFVFPWATEGATRPPSAETADLTPFSPAWLRSVLFVPTEPERKADAKAALLRGEALAAQGEHLRAIEQFEYVYATAPTEYKMCQRAGLDIAKSYKKLSSRPGDAMDRKAEDAKGVVWWWGRGTRWPGWYIIAYLSARNVYFTAKEDDVGAFTATEGLAFLVPIWFGLLFVLVTYGLPDY
jgi:hypothetical protein